MMVDYHQDFYVIYFIWFNYVIKSVNLRNKQDNLIHLRGI